MKQEEQIFRRIIDQRDRYYRIALSYVKNEQDAMDIVQDVACKALKQIKKLNNPEYAETWLFRVTINASIDLLRKRKREQVGLPPCCDAGKEDENNVFILDMLDCLDERCKAIIILHYFEGKTFLEIAETINENINTVKALHYKSLGILKNEIK